MLVPSIQKVKGHIIVWDIVVVPDTPKDRYIPYSISFVYLFFILFLFSSVSISLLQNFRLPGSE